MFAFFPRTRICVRDFTLRIATRARSLFHAPAPVLRQEAWRVAWRALAAVFIGVWMHDWQIGALVFVILYLFTNLRALWRLRAWLTHPKHVELPEVGGLWGEIYDELYTLKRRNRKRKKRLADILAEFRASTAALPYGTVVLSAHGQIAWFNAAAQLLLGLDFRKDVGQRVANLMRHPRFTEYLASEDYDRDIEVPSPVDPIATLSLRIAPYGRGQRLLIVRDVSELRRLEATRRDFVANASHELKTPLEVLGSELDVESRSHAQGAMSSSAIARMRVQVDRMTALVGDMLQLAQLETTVSASRQTQVAMSKLLEALRVEAESLSHGRHTLTFDAEAGLDLIGRAPELHSAFMNLIDNAIRYTPAGGHIQVRWFTELQGACLAVRDSGIGIAEKDLLRVSERFFRVDDEQARENGGVGLGLSIAKHAVERHDGRLQIESRPGGGSTFSCHFPAWRVRCTAANQVTPIDAQHPA